MTQLYLVRLGVMSGITTVTPFTFSHHDGNRIVTICGRKFANVQDQDEATRLVTGDVERHAREINEAWRDRLIEWWNARIKFDPQAFVMLPKAGTVVYGNLR